MPSDPALSAAAPGHARLATIRRQTLAFSVLGIVICVAAVAALEPRGFATQRIADLELLARIQTFGPRFDGSHAPALVGFGVAAGTLAGMLGMGGGVLKVAGMLIVFQVDILLARAISLTTMALATASAARVHTRNRRVTWSLVLPMLIPAALALFAGMYLGNVVSRAALTHFFAFFALFLALGTMAQSIADPGERVLGAVPPRRLGQSTTVICTGIGGIHGLVCGLIGISGGVVTLPLQQVILGVTARNAVANAVIVSAVITSVGSLAVTAIGVGRGDFQLSDVLFASLCIGGGGVIGGQIGARLTGRVPLGLLRAMFVLVTLSAGLLILFK
jgi:hypothetical protein